MNEYRVFYEHNDYGYYSTTIDDFNSITEALQYFDDNYCHNGIYGIMKI